MNCERARLLMGVIDEVDEPTRRAVRAHVNGCARCAEAWLAEKEFRYLMARRPPTPPPTRPQMERLLAVPLGDLTGPRVRLLVGRTAPILFGVLVLGSAFLLALQLTGRARSPEPATGGEQDLAIVSDGGSFASPTAVSRIQRPRLSLARPPLPATPIRIARAWTAGATATELPFPSAPAAMPPAAATPPPTWTPEAHDRRADAPPPPGPAAATSPPRPVEPTAPSTVPATLPPTTLPSATVPTATVAHWTIGIRVSGGTRDDPPTGTVVIQIDAVAIDAREWTPLYEVVAAFDAEGVAGAQYSSSATPPFAVSVLGLDLVPGFGPCPGETTVRDLTVADFAADSRAEVAYRLCPAAEP